MNREALVSERPSCFDLVQECHVHHRAALGLRIHHHTVPEWQRNGCMVGMTYRSPSIDARVASHDAPTPARGVWGPLQEALMFGWGDPVRVP